MTRSRVCLLLLLPTPIPYINSPSAFPSPPRCLRCLLLSPISSCVTSYLHITQVIRLTVLLFLVGDNAAAIDPGYTPDGRTRGVGPGERYKKPGDKEGVPRDDNTGSTYEARIFVDGCTWAKSERDRSTGQIIKFYMFRSKAGPSDAYLHYALRYSYQGSTMEAYIGKLCISLATEVRP